jgi:hypothetical protein
VNHGRIVLRVRVDLVVDPWMSWGSESRIPHAGQGTGVASPHLAQSWTLYRVLQSVVSPDGNSPPPPLLQQFNSLWKVVVEALDDDGASIGLLVV